MNKLWLSALSLLLGACTGLPERVRPVTGFDIHRYVGTWYEIARLDHRFERDMDRVTATYSLREDGGVDVLNRAYQVKKERWTQARGRAYFVGKPDIGHLKVSFFRPFYSSYVVFDLDADGRTAYVSGFNHDYLWLLSRTPQLSPAAKNRFVDNARDNGFDVNQIIWVRQPS